MDLSCNGRLWYAHHQLFFRCTECPTGSLYIPGQHKVVSFSTFEPITLTPGADRSATECPCATILPAALTSPACTLAWPGTSWAGPVNPLLRSRNVIWSVTVLRAACFSVNVNVPWVMFPSIETLLRLYCKSKSSRIFFVFKYLSEFKKMDSAVLTAWLTCSQKEQEATGYTYT